MSRNYNYIYSQLVEDKADIIGHIAYALYKEDKIDYITKYKQENGGAEPTEEDLKPFNIISSTHNSLDKYKFIASCILQSFLTNSLEESKKDVEENMNKNHLALMDEVIKPIKPAPTWKCYVHGVSQSVIGAFVFMLLLCGLMFILNFSENQYTFTFGGKGNAKIEKVDDGAIPQDTITPLSEKIM